MSILDKSAAAANSAIDPIAAVIKNPFSTTVENGGERGADFPGGFTITEYIEGIAQTNSIFQLIGNAMPLQPFPWGGKQRMEKIYYPGNPEPSVQIMGAEEGPLIIKGRWKDKRFKDPSYFGVSYEYNKAFNELRKRGNLVKFGMRGSGQSWYRWGFIERGEFKMNRLCWIDYEMEFFVVSEKQPVNNFFSAPEKQAPNTINSNLINQANDFQSKYSAVPTTMPLSIAGKINNLISGLASNVNLVTNFVGTVVATASDIQASANRALGLIKNARANLSIFTRSIDNVQHGFNTLSTSTSNAQKARSTYSNLQYILETSAATHAMNLYLAQMQAQFEALARTVPKARYRTQTGDTLQNISIKFYGISDHWTDIYDHNQLTSTVIVGGSVLEIPNL